MLLQVLELWLHVHLRETFGLGLTATKQKSTDKCFPIGNGRRAGQEGCFLNPFVHRRTAVAHSESTKAFSKWNPETAMLSAPFGCNHQPPPIPPFLLKQVIAESGPHTKRAAVW